MEEISGWVNDDAKKGGNTIRKTRSGPHLIQPDTQQSNVPTPQGAHLVLDETHNELDEIADL